MTIDINALKHAVDAHGRVARVVVADARGSVPREIGAEMLVWTTGQSGTIGGGTLEHEMANAARMMLNDGAAALTHHALGPDLGQCCGGRVSILTEWFDSASIPDLSTGAFIRPAGRKTDMPLSVRRIANSARGQGMRVTEGLIDGWMVENSAMPRRDIWVWGAGHVGRALVSVLSPLQELHTTWVDTGPERFPDEIPANVTMLPAANPALLVKHAPVFSEHLILTYSHSLDLELCNQLLAHGFSHAGLIGSASKWARFRKRLAALGHAPDKIARITCPIGDPALGKHPQMIAIGVARDMLRPVAAAGGQKMVGL